MIVIESIVFIEETSTAATIIAVINMNTSSASVINSTASTITAVTTNTSTLPISTTSTIASTVISSASVTTTPCKQDRLCHKTISFAIFSGPPISLLASVTASGYYSSAGSAASQGDSLVDRTTGGSGLSTGGYPPQYVQLEFPRLYNISSVYLQVGQLPNGVTQHQLRAGANLTSLSLVADMNNYTSGGEWINITFSPVLTDVRFLRLDTLSSPSWVAWIKFIVYDI